MNIIPATAAQTKTLAAMPTHRDGWMKWGATTRGGAFLTFYANGEAQAADYATRVINGDANSRRQMVASLTNRLA